MQLAEPLNLPKIEVFLCRENLADWMFDNIFLLLMKNCCHGPWGREIHQRKPLSGACLMSGAQWPSFDPLLLLRGVVWVALASAEQSTWGVWARTLEPVDHVGSLISIFLVDHFLCDAVPYCTLNRRTWWAGGDVLGDWGSVPFGKLMSLCLIFLIIIIFFSLAPKDDWK